MAKALFLENTNPERLDRTMLLALAEKYGKAAGGGTREARARLSPLPRFR